MIAEQLDLRGKASNPRLLKLPLLRGLGVWTKLLGLAAGGALILALATLQPHLPHDLPIAVFYILPVVLVAWVGGFWAGSVAAVSASFARMLADAVAGVQFSSPTVPYWNFAISAALYLIISSLLALLHRTLLYERELARTDALTFLGNRRFLEHVAAVELNRSLRYARPFALAYVDVDRFKQINDKRGHAEGDRLLRMIARVLVESLRTSDVVTRLGGDEFAVLLPETHADGARVAMEKAHERLTATITQAGYDVSFSVGVVTYEGGPAELNTMLAQADSIMYEVKKTVQGRVRCLPYGAPAVPA